MSDSSPPSNYAKTVRYHALPIRVIPLPEGGYSLFTQGSECAFIETVNTAQELAYWFEVSLNISMKKAKAEAQRQADLAALRTTPQIDLGLNLTIDLNL